MKFKARVYRADVAPSENAIRELQEFLCSDSAADELKFHRLLERHPELIGALGFSHFLSEYPLYKRMAGVDYRVSTGRTFDRADLVPAKTSTLLGPDGRPYQSAHIIELKNARAPLAQRGVGARLSQPAMQAIEQVCEYAHWLTTIPENRAGLEAIGWDVRRPSLHVIMGSERQFVQDPGQLEEIRIRFIEHGVFLWTVEDLTEAARRRHEMSACRLCLCSPTRLAAYAITVENISWVLSTTSFDEMSQHLRYSPEPIIADLVGCRDLGAPVHGLIDVIGEVFRAFGVRGVEEFVPHFDKAGTVIRTAIEMASDEMLSSDKPITEYRVDCEQAARLISLVHACFGDEYNTLYQRFLNIANGIPTYKARLVRESAQAALNSEKPQSDASESHEY